MQLVQVQIGQTFPVILGCFPDGTVALLKPNGLPMKPVVDIAEDDGVNGYFMLNEVQLYRGNDLLNLHYNTTYRYKEIPLLLAWLQQQQLHSPL